MANIMRWRNGDTNPVLAAVGTETVIEIGDLVCQVDGAAVPASAMADLGTEAGNQEAFHDCFLGVAMQCSPAGSTEPIRVATTGVFELDCLSVTVELGDTLGADEDGAGTALLSQTVVKVATANLAVGRCVKRVNPAGTRVLMDVVSTIAYGGVQSVD